MYRGLRRGIKNESRISHPAYQLTEHSDTLCHKHSFKYILAQTLVFHLSTQYMPKRNIQFNMRFASIPQTSFHYSFPCPTPPTLPLTSFVFFDSNDCAYSTNPFSSCYNRGISHLPLVFPTFRTCHISNTRHLATWLGVRFWLGILTTYRRRR